jgi:predicted oxidoreductase
MKTISLGGALETSELAYGCWRITGTPESDGLTPEREARGRAAILAAFEAGYRLFDFADIYAGGESERLFGRVARETPELRRRVLIASKCGIRKAADTSPEAPYRYDFSASHIVQSCEDSLRRLNVERIDLYQLHRPDFLGQPQEVAEAFSKLHQDGKVRAFGLSNFSPAQFALYRRWLPMPLIAHQVELSVDRLDRFFDGTLEQCMSEGAAPMAWSPLAGGRLGSNDPIDLRDPDHARRLHVREMMDLIARGRGTTRAVVAIAWLLRHPSGIVPIIGSTDPAKIRELTSAGTVALTREEWYRVLEASLGRRLP